MRTEIELLLIAIGGAIGAVSRYGIGELSRKLIDGPFPIGTLLANMTGCFLVGVLIGTGHAEKSDPIRLGIGIGFLGSLTTFSTFGAETMKCINDGDWTMALSNVGINVLLGLVLVFLGIIAGKKLTG